MRLGTLLSSVFTGWRVTFQLKINYSIDIEYRMSSDDTFTGAVAPYNWSNGDNWNNYIVPNDSSASVLFNFFAAPSSVIVDGNFTVRSILFQSDLPHSTFTIGGTGTLTLDGNMATIGNLMNSGTTVIMNCNIAFARDTEINISNGTLVINGNIDCAGYSLTVVGGGTLILAGDLSGTAISFLNCAGTGLVTLGGNSTATGTITVGTGGLTISSVDRESDMTIANAIVNNITGVSSALVVDATDRNVTLTGQLSGTATQVLDVTGDSTLTVSGDGVDLGSISVSGATFIANSNFSTATVTVSAGGTLGGVGSIGTGSILNATLAVGGSPGLLTFSSLILGDESVLLWELAANGTDGRGSVWDAVDVSQSLTIADGAKLHVSLIDDANLAAAFWNTTHNWDAVVAGNITGAFSSANISLRINGLLRSTAPLNGTSRGVFTASAINDSTMRILWSPSALVIPEATSSKQTMALEYMMKSASVRSHMQRPLTSTSDRVIDGFLLFYPMWIARRP
jgi:hypothetical protein